MESDELPAENAKKRLLLEDVKMALIKTIRLKNRIRRLNRQYSKKISELTDISKEIRAEAVTKLKFNVKVIHLMKRSRIHNMKSKFRFQRDKKKFSEILKNMGMNMMRELFLVDKADTLTKGQFRRYVEKKVKSFLREDYIDFESITTIHLFEKMKKALARELFNKDKDTDDNASNLISVDVSSKISSSSNINSQCQSGEKKVTHKSFSENIVPLNVTNNNIRLEKNYTKASYDNYIIGNNLTNLKRIVKNSKNKIKGTISITDKTVNSVTVSNNVNNTITNTNNTNNIVNRQYNVNTSLVIDTPLLPDVETIKKKALEFTQLVEEDPVKKIICLLQSHYIECVPDKESLYELAKGVNEELLQRAQRKDKTSNLYLIIEGKLAEFKRRQEVTQ